MMLDEFFINNGLKLEIKKSFKYKNLRLTIKHNAKVVVTAPWYLTQSFIESFVSKKTKWIIEKVEHFRKNPIVKLEASTNKDFQKNKQAALKLLKHKVEFWNNFYNFEYKKISVKNSKTRWGSCSKKGNLNFNYKVVYLEEKLVDYLVVHELCHLKEFNHSLLFWKLVGQTMPDYASRRKELKKIN